LSISFSIRLADSQHQKIDPVVTRLLGNEVTEVVEIDRGRNSRIYRVICGRNGPYIAKLYAPWEKGERDRLDAEFSGLRFLAENGISKVPRPIAVDWDYRCAIYEFIHGDRFTSQQIIGTDIDQCTSFLARLKELASSENPLSFPAASEACFSIQDTIRSIQKRLDRLTDVQDESPEVDALRNFLSDAFHPFLDEVVAWARIRLAEWGLSFEGEISVEERTLSPSDFGFHNALRCRDGRIIFLDFEHFGWDDPAKMIADFLLHPHPAMDFRRSLKRRFYGQVFDGFGEVESLAKRIEVVYPLFGLKWCTILLNEFVPVDYERRVFASGSRLDKHDLQKRQLVKAQWMLERVQKEFPNFPYRD